MKCQRIIRVFQPKGMEDVCDLSHLLQGEHHEKEKLELAIQDIDSTLEIESRRLE